MLEALKIVGASLGIIAFGWKLFDLFRAYLHIHLDLDHCGEFLLAKATVENKSSLRKRIDNAVLLVGPENENPVETYNRLAPIAGSMPTATCTNDITAERLPEPVYDGHGRMLIPLDFFYSENVAIADEHLSYVAPFQTASFQEGVPYAVRFFVWKKKRLHRSTHSCFVLNVGKSGTSGDAILNSRPK